MTKKKRAKHNRSVKLHHMLLHTCDGQISDMNFKYSIWFFLCVSSPPEGKCLNTIFRRLFLVICVDFLDNSNELINNELFVRWTKKECTENDPTDHRLLLLESLRCIGR